MTKCLHIFLFLGIILGSTAQDFDNCRYPVFVSADSLVNVVREDCIKKLGDTFVPDIIWRRYIYDPSNGINLDAAYAECQRHLIKSLGREMFCKYITMEISSFGKCDNRLGPYTMLFILELPGLENVHRMGYSEYSFETVRINYLINFTNDTLFDIVYPSNLPNCEGTSDCGGLVTKQQAVSIAKKIRFLKSKDKYFTEVDGMNWIITKAESREGIKSIKIDLQTGKPSEVTVMHRID